MKSAADNFVHTQAQCDVCAINYEDVDPQSFKEGLMQAQMPEDYAMVLVSLFEIVKINSEYWGILIEPSN